MFQFLLVFLKCFFLFFIAFSRPVLTNFQLRCFFYFIFLWFLHLFLYGFSFVFLDNYFSFIYLLSGCGHVLLEGNENCAVNSGNSQLWQLATGDWRLHLLSWQSANSSRESWPINMGGRPFLWQSNALFNSN